MKKWAFNRKWAKGILTENETESAHTHMKDIQPHQ